MRISLLCFVLAFSFSTQLVAQNLIQNGDFETHGALDCINCPMFANKYRAIIPPWENLNGGYAFICDCSLKKQAAAANDGICNFDKVSPHSGCNMMELDYSPSCLDQEHKTRGCSAYLGTKLSHALEIGKVYEVSFWLYILPPPATDADFARFIGINLYPNMVRNPSGKLLESNAFRLDTIIFGAWYPVKWLVRPLCNLQALVFGVFAAEERPPVNGIGHHNRFYIDDVMVKEFAGKQSDPAIVPYCRYTAKEKEEIPDEIEGAECFFNSGDSLLLPEALRALDSFAIRAKANPAATFMVVGRTDSIGNQHKALSMGRIKGVLDYLEIKHGIPRFRFLQAGLGDESPLATNSNEIGRQRNRSVQIQQMDCPMHLMLYRYLLLDVFAGNKTEAFKKLNIWLNLAPEARKLYALFDPRLAPLNSDPRWKAVFKKLRSSYQSQSKPALAFALDSLGLEDQKCRTLDRKLEDMHTYWAAVDSTDARWDVSFDCEDAARNTRQDEAHVKALIQWIGKDWPQISDIGKRPAKAAFLILSHTADTALIAQYLPRLEKNCAAGEAEWIHFATLTDRLLLHRGLPQRYGTQYQPPSSEADKLRLFPLENAAKVNEWRAVLGLEAITIEEE